MTYIQVIALYKAGLITQDEANTEIDFINLGSDCYLYDYI